MQLLQEPVLQVHVVPPLGKLPIVHVPEPPDDELPELPDEPELEDDDPEPELDELEPELLPELDLEPELEAETPELEPDELEPEPDELKLEPDELELELERPPEPEFEAEAGPELEPLDPVAEPDEPSPEPVLPSSPVQPPLSLADEHDASRAMTPGRTRRKRALMARLPVGVMGVCARKLHRVAGRAARPVLATSIVPPCRNPVHAALSSRRPDAQAGLRVRSASSRRPKKLNV